MSNLGLYIAQLLPRPLRGTRLYNLISVLAAPMASLGSRLSAARVEMLSAARYEPTPLMLERAVKDTLGITVSVETQAAGDFVVTVSSRDSLMIGQVRAVIDKYRMLGVGYTVRSANTRMSCYFDEHVCERVLRRYSARWVSHVCEAVEQLFVYVGYAGSDDFVSVFTSKPVASPVTVRLWETGASQPVDVTIPAGADNVSSLLPAVVKAEMQPFTDGVYYYELKYPYDE